MSPKRTPLVAGNWKMYKGPAEARSFAEELRRAITGSRQQTADSRPGGTAGHQRVMVAVFPPLVSLPAVAEVLKGTAISYGGQNCHWESKGAFTGEVSPLFLAELGCRFVLVGHSERRTQFGDSDENCRRKLRAALAAGVEPVLCCGETLAEREAGQTHQVIERQLRTGLAGTLPDEKFTIAYEPVWAIGTGRTATPGQAGEAHQHIRDWLGRNLSPEVGERTRLLYGGSVKPENFRELLGQPDVDGALVGGASLDLGPFCAIIAAAHPG